MYIVVIYEKHGVLIQDDNYPKRDVGSKTKF